MQSHEKRFSEASKNQSFVAEGPVVIAACSVWVGEIKKSVSKTYEALSHNKILNIVKGIAKEAKITKTSIHIHSGTRQSLQQ